MRLKKIFIVSLVILAILTIGAAAASENVTSDDLASDAGDVEISEAIADEDLIGAEDTDESEDVLGAVNGENTIENEETTGEKEFLSTQNTGKDILAVSDDVIPTIKLEIYKQTGKYGFDKKIYIKATNLETGKARKLGTFYLNVYDYKTNKLICKEMVDPDYNGGVTILNWHDLDSLGGKPGVYKIKITGAEYADYDDFDVSSQLTAKVTIIKCNLKITAKKLIVPKKSKTKFKIKLTGPNKKSVKYTGIKLKIFTGSKSKTVSIYTNSKGIATYKISKLSVGKHKVIISLDNEWNNKDFNYGVYAKKVTSQIIVKKTKSAGVKTKTKKKTTTTKTSTKKKTGGKIKTHINYNGVSSSRKTTIYRTVHQGDPVFGSTITVPHTSGYPYITMTPLLKAGSKTISGKYKATVYYYKDGAVSFKDTFNGKFGQYKKYSGKTGYGDSYKIVISYSGNSKYSSCKFTSSSVGY